MKLIFLGDSFTEGTGIDFEYGINSGLLKNDDKIYISNRSKLDKNIMFKINDFKKKNVWTKILCDELNVIEENLSLGGSGLDSVFLQLLESENRNYNYKDKFYIICLPYSFSGRMLIHNKKNKYDDNLKITDFFYRLVLNPTIKDIDFYKKYFNENYFKFYYMNSLMSIINFLKNKKIKFLFLPTWFKNIKEHFFLNNPVIKKRKIIIFNKQKESSPENAHDDVFLNFYNKFIFEEINDQLDFFIDISLLKKLPCGHPDIKSQYIIKDFYLEYIKNKVLI